jgi:diphosphomevalonate decarboxylase
MTASDQTNLRRHASGEACAVAHPNIALIKYWGKRSEAGNLPAVGSISMTLDGMTTRTRVRFHAAPGQDRVRLDGKEADAKTASRATALLDRLRRLVPEAGAADVDSVNDFPTGAGLASSASGFAALLVAAEDALGLRLPDDERSRIAREASGSAPRSLYGGFVEMACGRRADGYDAVARPLAPPETWPLKVVVAVVREDKKEIGSGEGMRRSMATSPYAEAWVASHPADLDEAREAIRIQDFERLAAVAEASCLKMHAVSLSARPGILYWRGATVDVMHEIVTLRRHGVEVFFTVDAGPQVKAVCTEASLPRVRDLLSRHEGVRRVIVCSLGQGASLLPLSECAKGRSTEPRQNET